jgi:hypothetical protein
MSCCDGFERCLEISVWFDVVELAGLDNRRDAGPGSATFVMPRIASCVSSGTQIGVNSPALSRRARRSASRLSVLIRSPGRTGISEGATT